MFGFRSYAIVIGDPRDAGHLAAFWNLRAAGYRADFFTGDDQLDRGLVRHVREHIESHSEQREWASHVNLFPVLDEEVPPRLAEILGENANPLLHRGLATAWSDETPPSLFATESHSVLANAEEDAAGRPVVHVALDRKPFAEGRIKDETEAWL
jgi:hypothetical protein